MNKQRSHDEVKVSIWQWMMGLVFPPYIIHLLFSKSRYYKLILIPFAILFVLVVITSVDTVLNPYRVETDLVEELVVDYVEKRMKDETFRKTERIGVLSWDQRDYLLYRVLTSGGSFDFVITPKSEGAYEVVAVYQTHPDEGWVERSDFILPPRAMDGLTDHTGKIGNIKNTWEEDGEYFVETSKGKYRVLAQFGQLIAIVDESGQTILSRSQSYVLPEKAVKYFSKNKEEFGEVKDVFDYEFEKDRESFHVLTDKDHWFRVDVYDSGAIEFFKATITPNETRTESRLGDY